MAKPILDDKLWQIIEPLLPPPKPRRYRYPGRKPIENRKALTGILFILKTGIPWEYLPQEMGCGSGMSCWRRLEAWHDAGIWQQLHQVLLNNLQGADQIDWSRAIVDSASIRALAGGDKTGKNPTDRGKTGSKHHLITEAQGIPLAAIVTGANQHDITQLMPLVDAIPPIKGKVGRPRCNPDIVQGDRGYDSEPHRKELRQRGIKPLLAKRYSERGSGLGKHRWVVERSLSWLHQFRRLRIRFERRDDIHEAFLSIGCSLICANFLFSFC